MEQNQLIKHIDMAMVVKPDMSFNKTMINKVMETVHPDNYPVITEAMREEYSLIINKRKDDERKNGAFDVVHNEGISLAYKNVIQAETDFKYYLRFWNRLKEHYDANEFPSFDFHMPYIRRFIFEMLKTSEEQINYIDQFAAYMIVSKDKLASEGMIPEFMVDSVKMELKDIKSVLNTVKEMAAERKEDE